MQTAILGVLVLAALAVGLSWVYFRRFQVTRPPIGVFNLRDIAFMIGGIILVPYLYLLLPLSLVAGLLGLSTLSLLFFTWEPILRARPAIWLVTLALLAADIGALLIYGARSLPFFAANDLVLLLAIVGLTNVWAQSGMRARDAAVLGALLAVYDFLFTTVLPTTADTFARLGGLPFAPQVAWPAGTGGLWASIGLGDLLLASVFPLVMRKAYGRGAGLTALALALLAIGGMFLLPIGTVFPAMVVLGPLMVAQYVYWARRRGRERTTREYLQAEPLPA